MMGKEVLAEKPSKIGLNEAGVRGDVPLKSESWVLRGGEAGRWGLRLEKGKRGIGFRYLYCSPS
jgi:hypothetical protein